jgi:hypothetical protein
VLNPRGSGRVGPQVVIDRAEDGVIAGWAADLDAADGTGVDRVDVWAYPLVVSPQGVQRGQPLFVGTADYGGNRPDVGAIFGEQFRPSGYGARFDALPPGDYDLAVFAYSTVVRAFVPARTVRVHVP